MLEESDLDTILAALPIATRRQPSTLNPQLSTLNPQPLTLNPQLSTLHPPPSTLNPQPSTLTSRPYTLHPTPPPSTLDALHLIALLRVRNHQPQTLNLEPENLPP